MRLGQLLRHRHGLRPRSSSRSRSRTSSASSSAKAPSPPPSSRSTPRRSRTSTSDEANHFAAASVNLLSLMPAGHHAHRRACVIGAMILLGAATSAPDSAAHAQVHRDHAPLRPADLRRPRSSARILQVHRRFGPPAFAPSCSTSPHRRDRHRRAPPAPQSRRTNVDPDDRRQPDHARLLARAFFVLVAGVLQVAILLPALLRSRASASAGCAPSGRRRSSDAQAVRSRSRSAPACCSSRS